MKNINNKRRKELSKILDVICDVKDELYLLAYEEECSLRNLHIRFSNGKKQSRLKFNVASLLEAESNIEDAIQAIRQAIK